jgi:hypothetical protein
VDVLNPCLPALDPRGTIFSHEFYANHIKDWKIVCTHEAPGAIAQIMNEDDPSYKAAFARENLAIVGRRTSLCLQSFRLLNELIPSLCLIGVPSHLIATSRLERLSLKVSRLAGVLGRPAAHSKIA